MPRRTVATTRRCRRETELSQLSQNINELEAGLAEYQQARAAPPPPQQQAVAFRDLDQALAHLPDLIDSEREYLREHPDAVRNPLSIERMKVAFLDAKRGGIERGSPEYFALFDDRLGYARRVPREREREPETETVTLNPDQRDAARIAGVDEKTYAHGVQRMKALRRDGFLQG
jgi:hypothetical protein